MSRRLTACLLLACLSVRLSAVVAVGDAVADVRRELGEPRASVPLPEGVQLLAFDRGNVWVRNGRVIGMDLLSSQAFAERQKADAALREQARRREGESAARLRAQALAAEAETKQQDALVEQVRREVRFPVYPTSAFGGYLPENDIREPPPGVVSVDFARPVDHDRDASGTIKRIRLYVSNRASRDLADCRLVTTFVGRDGEVMAFAQAPVPAIAAGGVVQVEVHRPVGPVSRSAPWIGDGTKVHEVHIGLYEADLGKVFLANSRWLRPE